MGFPGIVCGAFLVCSLLVLATEHHYRLWVLLMTHDMYVLISWRCAALCIPESFPWVFVCIMCVYCVCRQVLLFFLFTYKLRTMYSVFSVFGDLQIIGLLNLFTPATSLDDFQDV